MIRMYYQELDRFRISHSTILEHYQYIEFNLEGIYASLCNGNSEKCFFDGLQDVEKDSIPSIVAKIKKLDPQRRVLSDSDYEKIQGIIDRRNFWTHECYPNMIFDRNTKAPVNKYVLQLKNDLKEAEEFREYIFNIKSQLLNSLLN